MNILVLSYSTVVKELLKMVFKDITTCEASSLDEVDGDSYSAIFIDDSLSDLDEVVDEIINNFSYTKLVLIGSDSNLEDRVDISIQKPFLPNELKDILTDIEESSKNSKETNILNKIEIDRIKELMSLDEVRNSSSFVDLLERKESLNLKSKGAKEMLFELSTLDQKELKNLLKGAKVSIKIKFKSSDNE